MAHPLRKLLKTPKFDAVVSFTRPERSVRSPRASPSRGKSPVGISPTISRRERSSRPPADAPATKSQRRRSSTPSSKGGRGSRRSSAKEDGGVTSTVVAVLTKKGANSASKKNNYHVAFRTGDSANRADRLQARLNNLESDMNRLKLHEEQLEHRLKKFIRQKAALVNTIEDIHTKLECVARSHKSMSSDE